MASGVVVSQEIAAPRVAVWESLVHGTPAVPVAAGERVAPVAPVVPDEVGLGGTVLRLDIVDPVDGVTGTAVWGGVRHAVTAHLVDRGADGTLLVLTAEDAPDPQEQRSGISGSRGALTHRQVHRDLRDLAEDVRRRASGSSDRHS